MGYVLILVTVLSSGEVDASAEGFFIKITDCFNRRERLLVEAKAYEGYFDRGVQAVCVTAPEDYVFAPTD